METIDIDLPPVGVKLVEAGAAEPTDRYRGVSYCDAVRRATFGEHLLVEPGCIEVCRWAPPVLGLKNPEGDFENSLEPRLAETPALLLAPVEGFQGDPQVVIIRARSSQLASLVDRLGRERFAFELSGQIGKTALDNLGGRPSPGSLLSKMSNRIVGRLRRWKRFDDLTRVAFRSRLVSRALEVLIRSTVADMSICRNSTVIPLHTGRGNASFFCVGGVTWGRNDPGNMTMGLPFEMFKEVRELLEYPGKRAT
jgi:uncharacterized protein (DUF169 family)